MKHSNLPNKESHEWYVPPPKSTNIPSKSLVSFIKLIRVDSHQIVYSEFSICDCAERRRSFGNNWLGGLSFSINVQGLSLTPTWYCSYCSKAHSNRRYTFHYCLINLLIVMASLLLAINYPLACYHSCSSQLSVLLQEHNFCWLYS